VIGIKTIGKIFPLPVLVFIFSSIFFFAMAVALQCDDYHNRFFLTLMPLWAVLAIAGCVTGVSRLFTFFSK
jgi:hypothetical protein